MDKEKFFQNKYEYLKKLFPVIVIIAYVFFTLYLIQQRIPFFDEINAWNIAQNCSLGELLQVSRHEGHFLLWYMLIKPFAQNNIGFPISMFIINWIIAFFAVLVLWLKAPFNSILKTFITFSLPIQMFSIYARCYSIGMLILFILCSLYKDRSKHPIIISFLIILLANTSIIGTLSAFVFGIIYLIEMIMAYKNNQVEAKSLIKIISTYILGIMLVLLQMAFFVVPAFSDENVRFYMFAQFFNLYFNSFRDAALIILFIMTLYGWLLCAKNKAAFFFLSCTNILILFVALKIYFLSSWHYMFLYINVIVFFWMYKSEYTIQNHIQKFFYILFHVLCFCLIFYLPSDWIWKGFHMPTTKYLKQNIKLYNYSNIFLYPTDISIIGIVPSMHDANIRFYDAKGYSYKSYQLYVHQWEKEMIDLNGVKSVILQNKNKNNFLFFQRVQNDRPSESKFIEYLKNNDNMGLKFIFYDYTADAIIYKIELQE